MEKAIEIKRRAQRFVQSGDIDAALAEYEKLARAEENDPYHLVVIADLLFKKGDGTGAAQRYLAAADGYEKAGLYKNAIAICKKMARLNLAPSQVFARLAELHQRDGLATEASLYWLQHAEFVLRSGSAEAAARSFRSAFDASHENIQALERLAALQLANHETEAYVTTLREAAEHYARAGLNADALRCRELIAPHLAAAATAAPPATEASPATEATDGEAVEEPAPPAWDPTAHGLLETESDAGADGESEPSALGEEPGMIPQQRPGLDFGKRDLAPGDADDRLWELLEDAIDQPEIASWIQQAADERRGGAHDSSALLLLRAARAYDAAGDAAAADRVYRVMRESLPLSGAALLQWFDRCQERGEGPPAAAAAVELGREALARGDEPSAREWFERAFDLEPGNADAARRLAELDSAALEDEGPKPAASGPSLGPDPAPAKSASDLVAGVFPRPVEFTRPETPAAAPSAVEAPARNGRIEATQRVGDNAPLDLNRLVDNFRRQIEGQVSGDAPTHYALGVTYLEMGLVDQAVEALKLAGKDPALRLSAGELIGRCYMDRGRFDEAAQEFRSTLEHPAATGEAGLGLRFELGLALEAAGRLEDALAQFERVYAEQPSFPDAAMKIRVLRRTLERE